MHEDFASVLGGFPKFGVPSGDPHNKDYSILGSILGSPCIGKLPLLTPKKHIKSPVIL